MVRGHSEQFGRDAVALVESASFPNGQVVADLGISRSSLQAWLREGPACLARPVALARSHAIAPPWAPPRPDGRRPARGLHARVKGLWSGRTAGHGIGRPAASGLSANALSTARPAGAVDWRNHSLAIADPSPARRLSRL